MLTDSVGDTRIIEIVPPRTRKVLAATLALLAAAWVLAQSPFSPIPGRDAAALTGFAGLHPFRPIGTPLWGAVVWTLSHLPIPVAKSTILLQALLAGICVASIVRLLLRMPFRHARELRLDMLHVEARDRISAAAFGSLFFIASSSFLLTFAYPRPESLSVTLLLAGVACTVDHLTLGGMGRLAGAVALLSLSAAEHVAAVLLAPFIAIAMLARCMMQRESVKRLLIAAFLWSFAGIAAIAVGIALFMQSQAAEWREMTRVSEALRLFWQEYMARGPRSIPRVGWLAIAAFAFLPLPFLAMRKGGDRNFSLGIGGIALRLVALPIIGAVILFNLPGAPLRVALTDSSLPLVYAAAAVWAGRLWGYLFGMLAAFGRNDDRKGAHPIAARPSPMLIALWTAAGLLLTGCAAWRNRPADINRVARSAAAMAARITTSAEEGEWMLTSGELDDHLLIAGRDGGGAVRILNMRGATRRAYQRFLAQREPWFEPQWLQVAGFEPVLAQWMARAAEQHTPVRAIASLDLFAPAGAAMRPADLAYRLTQENAPLETLDREIELLQSIAPLRAARAPSASAFAEWFNTYLGRYWNEVGVELMRARRADLARRAFDRALDFDASNPAPHINRLLLVQTSGAPPDLTLLESARAALNPIVGARGGMGFQIAFGRIAVEGSTFTPLFPISETESPPEETAIERYARLAAEGRDDEARRELDALIAADPANLRALQERFALFIRRREFAAARADLAAMQRLGASPWLAQLAEGRLLIEEGRLDEAIAHFRALTLRHVASPDAFLGLALALDRAGRIEDWKRVLPDLDRVASNHPPSLNYLAENAAVNRDWVRARRYWERSYELDSNALSTLESLIRLDFMEQNAAKLMEHASAMLRRRPYHALAWYALGTGAALQGNWGEAVRAYEITARMAPSLEVFNDWGWALHKMGRNEAALEKLVAATESHPDSARAWATRGLIELELGRSAEAVAHLTLAMEKGARGREVLETLERALRAAGEKEKADRVRRAIDESSAP